MELLIVIGIIGILSSIVLVSYKDYSKKAKISNAMQWAKSVHSELGAYAVGGWSFDNIIGNTVLDDSGNGNNGTIYGATQVDGVVGKALSFDGVDDYVDMGNGTSINNFNEITIAAWIKTPILDVDRDIVGKTSSYVLFLATPGYARAALRIGGVMYDFGNWPARCDDNIWHHIVFTRAANSNTIKKYQDGKLVQSYQRAGANGAIDPSASNPWISKRGWSSAAFNGLIDDVRIYKEALTQARIQQHYAEGLKTHQNLARIENSQSATQLQQMQGLH